MASRRPLDAVLMHWIPLGAGTRVVPRCGRAYERFVARREGRRPRPLFHAALEVTHAGTPHVIEMAPAWGQAETDRGAVCQGPVVLRPLGLFSLFRYEVRCWPHGQIPDLGHALGGPSLLTDPDIALRALEVVLTVPSLTWGRDELKLGDMWNSNSLVAWLLARSGLNPSGMTPPFGGRAPGWDAGLVLAQRQARTRYS